MVKKRLSTSIKEENNNKVEEIKKHFGLSTISSVINYCIAFTFGKIKEDKKDE